MRDREGCVASSGGFGSCGQEDGDSGRKDEKGGEGVDLDGIGLQRGWGKSVVRNCIHCQCHGVKEASD